MAILVAFSGVIPGHVITQIFPSGSFWVNLLEFDLFLTRDFPGSILNISSLTSIRNHGGLLGLREARQWDDSSSALDSASPDS